MKLKIALLVFWLVVPIFSLLGQMGETMPAVEGETFSDRKIVLPDAARGHVAVLIFGFTKASKEPTNAWANRLFADFHSRDGFEIYQLPVLEDVPRFIRGMVISSIRKGVREDMRDHFMPVLEHESELKQFVHYKEPNDAYLVLLDASGRALAQQHGPFATPAYAQLSTDIEKELANNRKP